MFRRSQCEHTNENPGNDIAFVDRSTVSFLVT